MFFLTDINIKCELNSQLHQLYYSINTFSFEEERKALNGGWTTEAYFYWNIFFQGFHQTWELNFNMAPTHYLWIFTKRHYQIVKMSTKDFFFDFMPNMASKWISNYNITYEFSRKKIEVDIFGIIQTGNELKFPISNATFICCTCDFFYQFRYLSEQCDFYTTSVKLQVWPWPTTTVSFEWARSVKCALYRRGS